jgi:lipoic acid synthetase
MKRFAPWLRQDVPQREWLEFSRMLQRRGLDTICFQARCPNVAACFKNKCATFLILGPVCTRQCRFCAVKKSPAYPLSLDNEEPGRIARAVADLRLSYCVITSVTRDDLEDQGAGQFARTIKAIRRFSPDVQIEVLIPDLGADERLLRAVIEAQPAVIGHNLETVKRLYHQVRPQADYQVSLAVLRAIKNIDPDIITKSSLMLGLSETGDEVVQAMHDLRDAGCDILTLGQYLAPSEQHVPVHEYVVPERFDDYGRAAAVLGFSAVSAGPLVRSSFKAEESFRKAKACMTRSSSAQALRA